MKLTRVEAGVYSTDRGFRVLGVMRRMGGRQGSRVNHWLVVNHTGKLLSEHPTLARVREAYK